MSMTKQYDYNPLLKSYPDSEKVNRLSMAAETLYTRLLAQSDDAHNYYGDPAMIAFGLFKHRLRDRSVTVPKITRMRNELVTVGLAVIYKSGEDTYLHLLDCFKTLRKDVTPKIRFPAWVESPQVLTPQARSESVTEPGRNRDGCAPEPLLQTHIEAVPREAVPTPEQTKEALVVSPKPETTAEVAFRKLAALWNNCPEEQVKRLKHLEPKHPANSDRLKRLRKAITESAAWVQTAQDAIAVIKSGGCAGWFGNNDRGWKPGFGFLFERDKLGKILDGSYAPTAGGGRPKTKLEQEMALL